MQPSPNANDPHAPRKRIALLIAPGAEPGVDAAQRRTLAAVEQLFPVHFEASPTTAGADGALLVGALAHDDAAGVPSLRLPGADSGAAVPESPGTPGPADVSFPAVDGVPRPLQGRSVEEREDPPGPSPQQGDEPLAVRAGRVVWWRVAACREQLASAYPLASLAESRPLRDQLRAGRLMGLLPLLALVRRVLADELDPPPLRASFVFDDPNLHRPTYGYVRFSQLADHAARHGYHVAFATVPIDGWLADRATSALFASRRADISLVMHGNDHVARELDRARTESDAQTTIAQAMRRIDALERRSGVPVDRVMTPPHGACSREALHAMFRLGVEAVSVAPAYPWNESRASAEIAAEWHPTELVAGGIPVLPRFHMHGPREELALRALLGQPLIVYGHHEDLADGPDVLDAIAEDLDAMGETSWMPLAEMARHSHVVRRLGDTLVVFMHSRRASVQVPAGVERVRVLVPEPDGGSELDRVACGGESASLRFASGWGRAPAMEASGGRTIEITTHAADALDPRRVPAPRPRLWPLIRRAATEGRDRLAPQVRALARR